MRILSASKVFVREATGLVRELSAWKTLLLDLFAIAPAMVLVWTTVGQATFPGANLLISIVLAMLMCFVGALTYAMMAIVFPRSGGGEYVGIGRIIHPSLGFAMNFAIYLTYLGTAGPFAVYISSFGFAPLFAIVAQLTGSPTATSLASIFAAPMNQFVVAVACLVLLNVLVGLGARVHFTIKNVLFVITYIGIFGYIALMLVLPQSSFVANFNTLSPVSYDKVISAAQATGANLNFNWTDTLGAVVFMVLAMGGYTATTYAGGEVRNPEKGQMIGVVGSMLIYAFLMLAVVATTYATIGHDFWASLGYLAITGNGNYTLPVPLPILSALAAYGTNSVPIAVGLSVAVLVTLFGCVMALTFTTSRMVFAWSFDAIVPTKFADVNDRFHTPHYALVFTTIIEVLFVYLTIFTSATAYLTYDVTDGAIVLAVLALAAILFSFRQWRGGLWKDMLDSSPAIVNKKVAGIPLVRIVGVLSLIVASVVAYETFSPAITGAFTPAYLVAAGLFFLCPFVYYWISRWIQLRRGIPINMMHAQIPPE